jgi:hypothetical protein
MGPDLFGKVRRGILFHLLRKYRILCGEGKCASNVSDALRTTLISPIFVKKGDFKGV